MKLKFVKKEDFYSEFILNDRQRIKASAHLTADIGDTSFAYSYFGGCLITRLFTDDLGYYFWPVIPLRAFASVKGAYAKISEYARLEAIKEVYVELPKSHASIVSAGKPYATVTEDEWDEDDEEGGSAEVKYIVEIETECTLAEDIPETMLDDIYLSELTTPFAADYERLVRSEEVNRYFGYSYLDDNADAKGADFIRMANEQFERGEAMNFAVTVLKNEENLLIGEGTLYGFDGSLGASVSFRLLPEWQGRGYGKKLLMALIKTAREMGLARLFAKIDERNARSLSLVSGAGRRTGAKDGAVSFEIDLRRAYKRLKIGLY